MYISEWDVAETAKGFAMNRSKIYGNRPTPKHQIDTSKIRALGMTFGGRPLFEDYIRRLLTLDDGNC